MCRQQSFSTGRTQTKVVVKVNVGKPRIQQQNPNRCPGIPAKHIWDQFKVEFEILFLTFSFTLFNPIPIAIYQ